MKLNRREEAQLQHYLNKWLDDMPLLEPEADLTDRIMKEIQAANSHVPRLHVKMKRSWRKGIGHSLVAAAATVLFITSGILHRLLTIDEQITQLPLYIEKLTRYL